MLLRTSFKVFEGILAFNLSWIWIFNSFLARRAPSVAVKINLEVSLSKLTAVNDGLVSLTLAANDTWLIESIKSWDERVILAPSFEKSISKYSSARTELSLKLDFSVSILAIESSTISNEISSPSILLTISVNKKAFTNT